MKIALIGYGKMGRLVETVAKGRGHTIVAIIDPHQETKTIDKTSLKGAEVCIDFTHPTTVLSNLKACASLGLNVVIGTTGWDQQLPQVKEIVNKSGIGCLYSANFSIGVNLFIKMVEEAAKLMNHFDEYDVAGLEYHHKQKVDSPSGTAKMLTEALLKNGPRKKQCDFSSVRCGSIPGTHTIVFDSPADTITLSHEARSREGFAKGAVTAAEWIQGKKGLFTINDLLGDS